MFSVTQVLPPTVLEGANYRLSEDVSVQEYHYVFTVQSDFGEITAQGRPMLGLRLRELQALAAARKVDRYRLLVDGILTPLKNTGKGLDLILHEPLESLEAVPEGLGLIVDQYADPADRRAGPPARRKLATELNCDPETRNPVLKKLLDELSLYAVGGSLLTEGGMYFLPVWGLGALPMTAQMKELLVNSPPSAINRQIEKELETAGVESSVRSRFRYSTAFTTVQRLQLMGQFRALEGVENRVALLEVAANAHNEAEALSAIRKGQMLVDLRGREALRLLESLGWLPLAVLSNGTHVLICPYDYLRTTDEVNNYVNAYAASHPNVTTVLVAAGRVSPGVRKTMESAHIGIVEEGMELGDQGPRADEG
ncbi:MAG: hypothetical protein MUC88_17890 [Planctomycetes bacterium]|nr:hypothetical protein [Planctomycetota bacterium]